MSTVGGASRRNLVRTQRAARLGGVELELGSAILEQTAAAERSELVLARARLAPLPPVAERSALSEDRWQAQVIAVINRLGWWCYHPKLSRWSARGWPDLSVLGQRAMWLELKSDSGQLTPEQVAVIERMERCGLEVHVLRPWHGLERVVELLASGANRQHPERGNGSSLHRGGGGATVAATGEGPAMGGRGIG